MRIARIACSSGSLASTSRITLWISASSWPKSSNRLRSAVWVILSCSGVSSRWYLNGPPSMPGCYASTRWLVTPRGRLRLTPRRAGLGDLCELGDRSLDPAGNRGDVLHRVVVREQHEVDAAVVGHDRDEERLGRGQEADR